MRYEKRKRTLTRRAVEIGGFPPSVRAVVSPALLFDQVVDRELPDTQPKTTTRNIPTHRFCDSVSGVGAGPNPT